MDKESSALSLELLDMLINRLEFYLDFAGETKKDQIDHLITHCTYEQLCSNKRVNKNIELLTGIKNANEIETGLTRLVDQLNKIRKAMIDESA